VCNIIRKILISVCHYFQRSQTVIVICCYLWVCWLCRCLWTLILMPQSHTFRCGGNVNYYSVVNLTDIPAMKEFWKFVKIWRNCHHNRVTHSFETQCRCTLFYVHIVQSLLFIVLLAAYYTGIAEKVFSECELMFMFAICRRASVVCRLSVCNVREPYSAD